MDPPYEEKSAALDYAKGSEHFDFNRFADVVSSLKGKWLITTNDSPKIRSLFKAYTITPVKIRNGNGSVIGGTDRNELLITNWALPKDSKSHLPSMMTFRH
jgi:site-specific DNA-adenine methylase